MPRKKYCENAKCESEAIGTLRSVHFKYRFCRHCWTAVAMLLEKVQIGNRMPRMLWTVDSGAEEATPNRRNLLTLPQKKEQGIWLWVRHKGSDEMLFQGSRGQCEAWLARKFLLDQYTLGHILISHWSEYVEPENPEPTQGDGPPDNLPPLPPDHILD